MVVECGIVIVSFFVKGVVGYDVYGEIWNLVGVDFDVLLFEEFVCVLCEKC